MPSSARTRAAAGALVVAAALSAAARPAAAAPSGCPNPSPVTPAALRTPGDVPDARALLDETERATRSHSVDFAGDFVADGKVFIGFTRGLASARAEIDAAVPRHDLVVVYPAVYSSSTMNDAFRAIGDDMVAGGLPGGIRVSAVTVDVLRDRVEVMLPELRPAWTAALRARYGGCLLTFAQGVARND